MRKVTSKNVSTKSEGKNEKAKLPQETPETVVLLQMGRKVIAKITWSTKELFDSKGRPRLKLNFKSVN